jgi:hypothetical protein
MEESIMVMEKSRSSLESLSQLAPQLNKTTDLYMEELKEIEAALNKLNLGIAVERSEYIEKTNTKTNWNDEGEPAGDFYTAWTLGYGRDNRGNWCFLVREYRAPAVTRGLKPHPEEVVEESVTPLLQVSRDLRIAAAEHIPGLLKEIETQVKRKIGLLAKVSDKR